MAETRSVPRIDIAAALKEAGLAGLVALGLAIPLAGFRTVDQPGGLGFETRFGWVAIAVAAVFIGRLLLIFVQGSRPWGGSGKRRFARFGENTKSHLRIVGVAGLLFGVAMPLLPFADRYYVDLGTTVLIYVMLGWGLNIVVGLAGLLDLGYVAFYAIGAYSFALFAIHFDVSFWAALPVAGILAAFLGVLLGFPVLRLRGDYLDIVTLGFGEIIRIILLNWYQFTGGPNGLSGIPRPTFFGLEFSRSEGGFADTFGLDYSPMHRLIFLYYVILMLALITNLFTLRIRRLPVGRAWEALREDEIACRALGINPTITKLSAFAIGAMFGGFAGAFFAARQGFISPESFTFLESALILAVVVLGGMGSQTGVVIAALFLVLLPEFARDLAQFRMLLFGGAMVLVMIWRPRGLLAHREPTVRLPDGPPRAEQTA